MPMINLQDINETIHDLEQQPTNFTVCEKLAILYTVRNNIIKSESEPKVEHTLEINPVVSEYMDILPSYERYCEDKRKFQLGELTQDKIINDMKDVCKEIQEFITTLYSNTDTIDERELISNMINNLHY